MAPQTLVGQSDGLANVTILSQVLQQEIGHVRAGDGWPANLVAGAGHVVHAGQRAIGQAAGPRDDPVAGLLAG